MTLSKNNITTLNSFLLKEGFPGIAENFGEEELKTFLNTARNLRDETPLYLAVQKGKLALAQLLIDSGADVNQAKTNGTTPLLIAAELGELALAKLLIQSEANVNQAKTNGTTPLYFAARKGTLSLAKLLIKSGADVDQADTYGFTPLFNAAVFGHKAVAKLLIDSGADVNLAINDGATPLYIAAKKGQRAVAELLIDSGADVNLAINDGTTPLHVAALNGKLALVELLIKSEANVNQATTYGGVTPLFTAAVFGHKAVAKLLLDSGADVNKANTDGKTPLYIAAQYGHTATAQLLLFATKLSARPDVRLLPQTMNADPIIKQILDCDQDLFKDLRDNLNLIAKEDKDELSNSPSTSNTTTEPINTSQIALKALYEHFVRGDNLPQLLKTFIARTSPDQINRFNRFNLNDPQSLLTFIKLSEEKISAEISTNIAQYAGPFSKKRLESLLEAHFNGEEPQDLSHVARLSEKRAQKQVTGAQPNGR